MISCLRDFECRPLSFSITPFLGSSLPYYLETFWWLDLYQLSLSSLFMAVFSCAGEVFLVCSLSVMLGTLRRGLPCRSELVTSTSDCCDNMIAHARMLTSASVYSISVHAISTLMLRSIMIKPSSLFLRLTLHFQSYHFWCVGMCHLSPISVLCLSQVTMF